MQTNKNGIEARSAVCRKCGLPMLVRHGACGSFLGCSGYPKCKGSSPVLVAPGRADAAAVSNWRCIPGALALPPLPQRENHDADFCSDALLPHPMIEKLLLSRDDRLYGDALVYKNGRGEIVNESPTEKRFRVLWKKPLARF